MEGLLGDLCPALCHLGEWHCPFLVLFLGESCPFFLKTQLCKLQTLEKKKKKRPNVNKAGGFSI